MIDAEKNEIWDRQPGETAQWYNRFTRYRLMGLSRSIRKVFEAENRRSKNLPGNWLRVAEKWNWRERAEAWDFAEIEMQRVKNEEILRNELQAHYENCLIMSREGLAATHRLLNLVNAKLSILEKKAEAGEDVLEVRDLPNFIRTIAAVGAMALESEALVLDVRDLLEKSES